MYNINNGADRWLIYTSFREVLEHFSLALTCSIYCIFIFSGFFYLENIGQDYDGQHSQWRHSMAGNNLYKSRT